MPRNRKVVLINYLMFPRTYNQVFQDKQIWQKSVRQVNSGKNKWTNKSCLQWDLNFQPPPIWHVLTERSFKWIICSHTPSIPEITQVQKMKWCMKENSFEKSPIQYMSRWPLWLSVRLQMSDGCCWKFTSKWRQLFSKNLFVWQIFCQICLSWKTQLPLMVSSKVEHTIPLCPTTSSRNHTPAFFISARFSRTFQLRKFLIAKIKLF